MSEISTSIRKDISLYCSSCGATFIPDMWLLACNMCQEPLLVKYQEISTSPHMEIPVDSCDVLVSLGEGNTPVVKMDQLRKRLSCGEVFGKLEFMNPTGSFKDRGTAMMISVAKGFNIASLVEDSSGNAGSSVAAYCTKADITAHIFVPSSAPKPKLDQISVYGAITHKIEGTREMVTDAASNFVEEKGYVYGAHKLSPYFLEGTKTFAYEIARHNSGEMPDHLIMPVGNGSLYIGAWLGFKELIFKGVISKIPKMHVVQAEAVKPLVNQFEGNDNKDPVGTTVAGGISVSSPPRSKLIGEILVETGGHAAAVDDEAILEWQKILAQENGIYCEPTSSSAFAGLDYFIRNGVITKKESVLVAVTGFGLKDNLYI